MSLPHDLNKDTLPPDGGERFNRLIFARSPYLLQHAENPVDWYEWGNEAFAKAHAENRPVFLSIGYATCHWCHVMAHESFEDNEVADLLNRHFVCIKVDREERPDIDDFFMAVSQAMTGSGGWPLNIFMTPDKRPFMAMTYLPKRGRNGRTGLVDLLADMAVLWRQRPDMIEHNCMVVMAALATLNRPQPEESVALSQLTHRALEQLGRLYDREWGGFGTAPKFPMPVYLGWLMEQGQRGNRPALDMALHTLRRIRSGGIWDHLGGGLHRYATDRAWLVPHFEKMLYDQALVALTALDAFQASGDGAFLRMAGDIFEFAERELAAPEGAFRAALDADSEGVEGTYYLWDKREVEECLGADAPLFCRFYDVTEEGNFEGRTILHIRTELEEFCARERLDPAETGQALGRCRALLLKRRETRIRPFRDDKILTAWNGLMIAAQARGGAVGNNRVYRERAGRAAACILKNLRRSDGRLLRSYRDGASDVPAFLEDYACLAFGLLELFEATLDTTWLHEALRLADELILLFRTPAGGMFGTIGHDAEQMPAPVGLGHDGVMPSPFSLAAQVLVRLAHTCERPDLLDQARALLAGPLGEAAQAPLAHLEALRTLALLEAEPVTITFNGAFEEQELSGLLAVVRRHAPGRPILKREDDQGEPAGVQVCGAGVCHPATRDAAGLEALLRRLAGDRVEPGP